MFFEKRFLNTVEQIRSQASVPLRIELWNGRRFDLCGEPNVTVTIPRPSALRYFLPPSLNSLGEAFVEGHIQVQGSPRNVFTVAEGLARSEEAVRMIGERRYRIWQIYLAGCAYGFANGWMNLYQVLCCKAQNTALARQPLTRDYMYTGLASTQLDHVG